MMRFPALLLTLAVGVLLALCSSLPLSWEDPETALVRLSWRIRGEETGECPRPTPEQLAELPPHMQNPDACLGGLPSYTLRLWVEGEPVLERRVEGGGVRGDRPLTVYEALSLPPGEIELRVEFQREDDVPAGGRAATDLRLERTVRLDPGEVGLIGRNPATGVLEFRRPVR